MPKKCGIYQIINTINNDIYIGSSVDIVTRFSSHKSCLRRNKHENIYLQFAWNNTKWI